MKELILLKIEELENEYNSIELANDELELSRIQRSYDEKNNALNVKKSRRSEIMKDITNYRDVLEVINQFEETEVETEEGVK